MKNNVLLVEDEAAWSDLARSILQKKGYKVAVARNADAAMRKIQAAPPDLVILDVKLEGISGMKLCEFLRAEPATASVPILMLTAMQEERDKVKGLEMGADDYLVKPFSHEELAARVMALLRRSRSGGMERRLQVKDICVDLDRHEVTAKGKKIELRPKEFDLLVLLMEKKGKVLAKRALIESVWGATSDRTSQTLAQHIKNLRSKLGPCSVYIETVETLGYKFQD